jgi:pilus assembly protein CpaB
MNTQRLVVLGLALVAAGGAAFLVRSMLGGGTPAATATPAPPPVAMSEVLVASANLQPGQALAPDQVRWEKWPTASVDRNFITHAAAGSIENAVKGTVVRNPIADGQPISNTAIVHADAAGFLAAMINPGMRAVSITISADSGAGGFILPNDRVDIIQTQKLEGTPPRARSSTILQDVRVLAVDQTFQQEKDTKTVLAKTATLELTPAQAELVARAQTIGQLSLSLRSLGDSEAVAANTRAPMSGTESGDSVAIIRYGVPAGAGDAAQGRPQ